MKSQVVGSGTLRSGATYRHEDSPRAREHALRDPLRLDPVSLGPLHTSPPSDADPEFEEIGRDILMNGDWKFMYASQWRRREDILRTEGRAMLWGARHKLRVPENFNMRHVLLVDYLGLALACGKGRAASPHLAPILRSLCALSLCTGAKSSVRWVPSELNPADAPSRRSPVPSAPAYVSPFPVGHGSATPALPSSRPEGFPGAEAPLPLDGGVAALGPSDGGTRIASQCKSVPTPDRVSVTVDRSAACLPLEPVFHLVGDHLPFAPVEDARRPTAP